MRSDNEEKENIHYTFLRNDTGFHRYKNHVEQDG